ncbi:small ribosomal subunit protein uS5m [Paramormyrops kingsleyae]|uniref:Small ribosomal subunit protein uS5m n=1 Tax=Paramormyrops kingsleyae TaxID=1676925 RepID=A0A3B3QIQ3_9TELE|nr:28S ribosomal protein S5, mitochondrial [Paramormyrops kingsleyae]
MAAVRWLSCVLRVTVRGPPPVQVLGGVRHLTHMARLASTAWAPAATSTALSLLQIRSSSFFNKLTAEELWKGVLASSGAGARKGRGKRTKKKIKKDLNKGQVLGEGRAGFLWPGLNMPVSREGTAKSIARRDPAEQQELQAERLRQREEWDRRRKMKVKRERGWTGHSWGGVSIGPPDPGPNGETYEDFNSRVIEVKNVFNMTAKEGRKKSVSCLVAVGNGDGVAGFALGKATDRMSALRKAKNRAVQYLYYIERFNNHTIYHDVTSTFKRTTLRMKKQNLGHGLHCHRAIITICKLIGIEDMYCKVVGPTNLLNLTRALFQGLASQKTHQDLAEKKHLHVVEFRHETGPLPHVVASPAKGARPEPEPEGEVPDTKLEWDEVRAAQGQRRSPWAGVKRTVC